MAPKRSQSRAKALRQGGATPRPAPDATTSPNPRPPSRQTRRTSYRTTKRSFWSGPYPYLGIVAVVLIAVVVVVLVAHFDTGSQQTGNVKTAISEATHVPGSVYNQVGTGSLETKSLPIAAVQSPTTLQGSDGKPEILYMGGEYCPYCAADRWVMMTALSRFGTFSGVQSMFSSSNDAYPNTPTFTFLHATYSSQYVDFVPVEMFSRTEPSNGQPNLQQPTAEQQQLMQQYDSQGGIPFLLIGGQYQGSTPFAPQSLAGKSQQQVAQALSDPSQQSTKDIIGNANLLTATICKITDGQPSTVCQSPGVQSASTLLGSGAG